MLLECVWKERQCYPENFTRFHHPLYGNCFSFNAGFDDARKTRAMETTSMPGPRDGLTVQLYAEEDEYVPLVADSVGARILIHDQGQAPQPEDTGYTLSAGFATALEIRKVDITRLPLPYNSANCSDDSYQYQTQVQAYWPTANYSMPVCTKLCYQELLQQQCGCVDAEILLLQTSKPPACDFGDQDTALCAAKLRVAYKKGTLDTQCSDRCPQACREVDYEVHISSALWPNQYYMVRFSGVYCEESHAGPADSE